ncbi:MAG TPA: nuclear transport factor 2 family protein [Gaiellaceae bacterium]|nr:nuclear transport factor 2 family protein [Gaiellaceae bacterium]
MSKYLEALWGDDFETAYALLDPDVDVIFPRGQLQGADRMRAMWSDSEEYDHLTPAVVRRQCDEGDGGVHATTRIIWHWKESGEVAFRSRFDSDFVLRDDKIVRIETVVEHRQP